MWAIDGNVLALEAGNGGNRPHRSVLQLTLCRRTGTGKTAAYALPVIQKILNDKKV